MLGAGTDHRQEEVLSARVPPGGSSPGHFEWGEGDELSVIAAAILGGASLFGGKGSVVGGV